MPREVILPDRPELSDYTISNLLSTTASFLTEMAEYA